MKNQKVKVTRFVLLGASTLLLSCAPTGSSSSLVASASLPSSSINSSGVKSLALNLKKSQIVYGLDFYTGCHPSVVYSNNGKNITFETGDGTIIYSITGNGQNYDPSALLPVGKYTAKATYFYAKLSTSKEFEVIAGTPLIASEGKGYETVDISRFSLAHYPQFSSLGKSSVTATGSTNILVIPIYFKNNDAFTADELSAIQNAYNGEASSTGWESLRSYYTASSYDKWNLQNTIAAPYQYPETDEEFETTVANDGDDYVKAVWTLAEAAISSASSSLNLADFDNDDDGDIDGLELIYKTSRPDLSSGGHQVWWNYTSSDNNAQATTKKVSAFFWSELNSLQNGYLSPNIDCHTLVHETGHMLGLVDYYPYGDEKARPTGFVDMMDANLGDHNAYSKMLLGWANPKIPSESATDLMITLNSFTESGDVLLLKNSTLDPWNQTPYDEYFLLQYYTPTGLNLKDGQGYPRLSSVGKGGAYAKAGLEIYHVDSRLYLKKESGYAYTDDLDLAEGIAASNTSAKSLEITASSSSDTSQPNVLLQAIPATGTNLFAQDDYRDYLGSQSVLFSTDSYDGGASFFSNPSLWKLLPRKAFANDGAFFNWAVTVQSQNDSQITLHLVQGA